jgi:hypothetical protein
MSSDTDEPRNGERPVDPPIIDLEAEEISRNEEASSKAPGDQPAEEGGRRQWPASFWPATALAAVALAVAIGSLAAAGGWITLRTPEGNPVLEARLAGLEAQGREIEQGLARLATEVGRLAETAERPVQAGPTPAAALEGVAQQMDARSAELEQMIERIGASLSAVQTNQKLQQEEFRTAMQRLGEMQAQVNSLPATSAVPAAEASPSNASSDVAAAVLQLKTAVNEGRPFGGELQRLRATLPAVERYPELAQASSGGVAREADLTGRLRSIIEEARAPQRSQTATSPPRNVWDAFKSKAASLISVRKLDDAKWRDLAESALLSAEQGDLRGAVQILGSAQGQKPPEIATWLGDAELRLHVGKALEALSAAALEQLGGRS